MKNLYLIFTSLFILGGCIPEGPVVYVPIKFVASKKTPPLNQVRMTSGADKDLLTEINPGETQTARIYPTAEATMNEVSLFVYMLPGNRAKTWEGKRFPIGSSYRTHIQINEEGKVLSQRSCIMPCELD